MVFQQNLLRLAGTKNNLHHCEGKKPTNMKLFKKFI